jgi:endonuclease/exonuclease/phosphatase family metal-dependent hydrolase
VRKDLDAVYSFHEFVSMMGRELLLTEIKVPRPHMAQASDLKEAAAPGAGLRAGVHAGQREGGWEKIVVGNVHLESLSSHKVRISQMETCAAVMGSFSNAILCGDFNFCSYRNFHANSGRPLENNDLTRILPGACHYVFVF